MIITFLIIYLYKNNIKLGDNKNRNMEKPVVKLRFPNFKYVSFAENISKMIIFST